MYISFSESRCSTPVQNVHQDSSMPTDQFFDSLPTIQVDQEDYNPKCPALFDETGTQI